MIIREKEMKWQESNIEVDRVENKIVSIMLLLTITNEICDENHFRFEDISKTNDLRGEKEKLFHHSFLFWWKPKESLQMFSHQMKCSKWSFHIIEWIWIDWNISLFLCDIDYLCEINEWEMCRKCSYPTIIENIFIFIDIWWWWNLSDYFFFFFSEFLYVRGCSYWSFSPSSINNHSTICFCLSLFDHNQRFLHHRIKTMFLLNLLLSLYSILFIDGERHWIELICNGWNNEESCWISSNITSSSNYRSNKSLTLININS